MSLLLLFNGGVTTTTPTTPGKPHRASPRAPYRPAELPDVTLRVEMHFGFTVKAQTTVDEDDLVMALLS